MIYCIICPTCEGDLAKRIELQKKKKLSVRHSWVVNKPIYGSSVSMFNPKFQYAFQMSYSCKVGAASYNLVYKFHSYPGSKYDMYIIHIC